MSFGLYAYRSQKDDWFGYALNGGLEGDRTLDLRDANAALSQLSHEPISLLLWKGTRPACPFPGAPGGTRTPDLLVRSQSLYPAELRAHTHCLKQLYYFSTG